MYQDIFTWEILGKIKAGQIVNVTDRMKGETLYVNGMTVNEFAELMNEAENDKIGRFHFYVYTKEVSNGNPESA